jgi:hypothetical protein
LKTEKEFFDFLNEQSFHQPDLKTGMLSSEYEISEGARFRYQTRVVGFFFDKSESRDEIKALRKSAVVQSGRINLRIGMVTDSKLIKALKVKYPAFFA